MNEPVDIEWMKAARCRDVDPAVMFPDLGDDDAVARAESVCVGCPVIVACGLFGRNEHDGVWGGIVHKPRAQGRKKPRYAPNPETGRVELITPTPAPIKGEPVRIEPRVAVNA